MTSRGRLLTLAVIGVLIAVVGVDWLQAQARLDNISIEGEFDRPDGLAMAKDVRPTPGSDQRLSTHAGS